MEFDTPVVDHTGIDPLVLDTGGIRKGDAHDLVGGRGVVVGDVEAEAVLEEVPFSTDFPGIGHFGLQVRIGLGGVLGDGDEAGGVGGAAVGSGELVRLGVLTHERPGGADLTVVHNVLVVAHAHLVQHSGDQPGGTHGRIEIGTVVGREGGGPVVTGGQVQEQEVLPAQVRKGVEGLDFLLIDGVVGILGTGVDIHGAHDGDFPSVAVEAFGLDVHQVAAYAGAEIEVTETVVVGEEAFKVALDAGGLAHVHFRIGGGEYGIQVGIPVLGLVVDPVVTFLEGKVQVLGEVDGHLAHAEELVLNVLVVELALDEVGVLVVGVRTVPVDVGHAAESGGVFVHGVLLQIGHPDAARQRRDVEGGAVQAAGLAVVAFGADIVGLDVEVQPLGGLQAGDEVHAGLVDGRGLDHGLVVVTAEGQAPGILLAATGDGDIVALSVACAIVLLVGIRFTLIDGALGAIPPGRFALAGHLLAPGAGGVRVVGTAGALSVGVLEVQEIGDGRPGELAGIGYTDGFALGAALLGGDEDDTVTGAGTVQGRGGRAFQNGDALNVLGVEVESTATAIGTAPEAGLAVDVVATRVVRDTVHDVEGLVIVGEGGGTADDHAGGSADTGTGVGDLQAGDLSLEGVREAHAAAAGELFRLDVLHGVAEGLLFTGDAEGGDDNFVQEFAVFLEDDVLGGTVEHVFDGRIADAGHLDGGADRHVVDREGTVGIGDGAVGGSRYHDARADDGADVVGDDTGGRTVLGGCGPGNAYEDRSQQD